MSLHDDDPGGGIALEPAALDRLWDAANRQFAPVGGRTGAASIQAAETIRQLDARDDAPHATTAQLDAIWASVAAATLPAENRNKVNPAPAPSVMAQMLALVQTVIRQTAVGALAGMLVGMIVIGLGARILMRISGMLSSERASRTLTENGNTVGEITLGGTLALMIFVGLAFGVMGGVAVMAVRPWLPAHGWRRYLATGIIGFAVAGPIVLEGGNNPDYERFGILGLNICLFTMLPFLFGLAVMPVIDAFDRRISPTLPGVSRGWSDLVKSLLMVPLLFPLVALIAAAFELEPVGLLLLLPVVRFVAPLWSRHAPTIDLRGRRELRGLQLGHVALAIPCLLGLTLMAQSIARLMN